MDELAWHYLYVPLQVQSYILKFAIEAWMKTGRLNAAI